MESMPAEVAKVWGTISSESAKAFTANCSLPPILSAYSRRRLETSISTAPPPVTYFPDSRAARTTPSASCMLLSASSTTCSVPPRISMLTAFGFLQSLTKIISSPPIFFSSTSFAWPRSDLLISFICDVMRAPVALASFFMSDSLTLLTARIPAFVR